MKRVIGAMLLLMVCCAPVAHAGLFGESEEEKAARIAKHVADVLREPNKVIAKAQEAVELGDTEEGIRLFRKAQTMLEEIEATEDTRGSAFATLRLKKFHCVSMLDALVLKQSEVMDVRQAVTDTSELAARLAQERAELIKEAERQENPNALPKPPTLADQLAIEEGKAALAQAAVERCRIAVGAAKAELETATAAFTEAVKVHTAADTQFFMADQHFQQATREQKSAAILDALRATLEAAKRDLMEKKEVLAAAKEKQASAKAAVEAAEAQLKEAEAAFAKAEEPVRVLRKAIADEAEAARKKAAAEKAKAEAEAKRLEAENLKRKQAEAEAAAKAREKAAAEAAARDAALKQKAAEEAAALKKELEICEELWRMKHVEAFETHVTEALAKWPDSAELMVQLARLRLIQGQEEDVLELISMTSSKGKTGKQAAFAAAGAYLVKGLPFEAMKILEPVMESSPNDPDVYFNMAVVLVRLPEVDPDREIAAKYYNRSIELGGCRSLVLERRLGME